MLKSTENRLNKSKKLSYDKKDTEKKEKFLLPLKIDRELILSCSMESGSISIARNRHIPPSEQAKEERIALLSDSGSN
jgi:hypothetical protein